MADLPTPVVFVTIMTPWQPYGEVTAESYGDKAADQLARLISDKLSDILAFNEGAAMTWGELKENPAS